MAQPTGKLKFAYETIANMDQEIEQLNQEVEKLQKTNKNMHTCVSGYLKGKEWEHWQQFNEPRFILG